MFDVAAVIARTHAWNAKVFKKEEDIESFEFSDRAKKTAKIADTVNFGSYRGAVLKLAAAILGEPISQLCSKNDGDDGILFDAFTVVVPITEEGGHNYPIEKPALIMRGPSGALRGDGTPGNNLNSYKSDFRPATDAEITELVTTLNESDLI